MISKEKREEGLNKILYYVLKKNKKTFLEKGV